MLESDLSDRTSAAFSKLLAIMAKLRDPNGGCPWDLEQSFRTIVPHTIEEAYEVADAIEQTHAWERQKAEERTAAASARGEKPSALDGVTGGLPALTRAEKLQKRAARVGFEWPQPAQVLDKIAEETVEIRAALEQKAP